MKDDVIDLPDNAATICKFEEVFAKIAALGTHLRRGSAGVEYGNPTHLMDARFLSQELLSWQ